MANPYSRVDGEIMYINIAKEFYKRPAGREKNEGNYTGQHFREQILTRKMKEAVNQHEILIVDFEGTTMMGSSFLEESFGGLVRVDKLKSSDILKFLKIENTRESLKATIIKYIKKASA